GERATAYQSYEDEFVAMLTKMQADIPVADSTENKELSAAEQAELDKEYDETLEVWAAEGFPKVASDSRLGKRFARMLKHYVEKKAAHHKKSDDDKAAERRDWCSKEYEEYQASRQRISDKYKTERRLGKWHNFDSLVSAESGGAAFPSQACIRGAVNIAKECIRHHRSRTRINPDSLRLEFKRFEDVEEKGNTTTHRQQEQETGPLATRSSGAAASSSEATPAGTQLTDIEGGANETPLKVPAPKAAAAASPPTKQKGKGSTMCKGKGKGSKEKQKGRGAQRGGMRKVHNPTQLARKVKEVSNKYSQVTGRANNLVDLIDGNLANPSEPHEWTWARSDRFGGKLKRAIERVEGHLPQSGQLHYVFKLGGDLDYDNIDIHAVSAELDEINDSLDNAFAIAKKIRSIAE
ncbi:unnamed protein product, partial [Prorocentrum cordatum]